jgi:hypothetical protein
MVRFFITCKFTCAANRHPRRVITKSKAETGCGAGIKAGSIKPADLLIFIKTPAAEADQAQ